MQKKRHIFLQTSASTQARPSPPKICNVANSLRFATGPVPGEKARLEEQTRESEESKLLQERKEIADAHEAELNVTSCAVIKFPSSGSGMSAKLLGGSFSAVSNPIFTS